MEANHQSLTLEEAAFLLKVGVPTIENLIDRNLVSAEQREGSFHIKRDDLVELMRRNQREIDQNDDCDAPQDFGLMGKRTDEK